MPAFSVGMPRLREFDRGQAPKASRPRIVSKQRLKLQARSHHFNIRSSRLHDRTATRERKLERTSAPFYYFTGLGRRQGGRVGIPYLLFDPVPGQNVSPLTHLLYRTADPRYRTATPAPRDRRGPRRFMIGRRITCAYSYSRPKFAPLRSQTKYATALQPAHAACRHISSSDPIPIVRCTCARGGGQRS